MQMPRCKKIFFYLVIENEYFSPFSIVNAKFSRLKLIILQDESIYDKKTGGYLVVPKEALQRLVENEPAMMNSPL